MSGFNPVPEHELPDEVIHLLNDPAVDGKQPVHQLFTVDTEGWPHTALSSARQWWVGDERIACVILGGRTTSYLSERPQALLLVVAALQAYSIRLHSTMIEKAADGRVVVVFDVIAVESDTRGVALTPMQFEATGELTRREQVSESAGALAAQLTGPHLDHGEADS